jgi:hypothetical protein
VHGLTVHGLLFMPDTKEPLRYQGQIPTIRLLRELHAALGKNCPLIDAKYASEYPNEAAEYFSANKTLEGFYDEKDLIHRVKSRVGVGDLHTLMMLTVHRGDNDGMTLVAKAIRKFGEAYHIS